jgi:hypothetical protein
MIRYTLICAKRHQFESWFANSSAYDKQEKAGLLACPHCGSGKIKKALMAPRLARGKRAAPQPAQEAHPVPAEEGQSAAPQAQPPQVERASEPSAEPVAMMSPQEHEFRRKLRELRDHLVKNAENVGPRFPEEARKIHYGEAERRSIFGIASPQDAKELHEEGIEFSPLPVLPDERN